MPCRFARKWSQYVPGFSSIKILKEQRPRVNSSIFRSIKFPSHAAMGCIQSHPVLPPSPMPHTTSGPPPRPILTARAQTFYDLDSTAPMLSSSSSSSRSSSRADLQRRKAATWDIAPHSKIVQMEKSRGLGLGLEGRTATGGLGNGGYAKLEEGKRNKGQRQNRMKVGKDGEMWFF